MKVVLCQVWFVLSLCVTACGTADQHVESDVQKLRRFGMVTGLDPEKADYYKKLHADTWKGVLAAIHAYNIRNYSIYVKEIEGKQYLFSYYEYVGDDYEADMKSIAADTTTQRWWRETDPCQIPLPEAAAEDKIWSDMEEVFHAD